MVYPQCLLPPFLFSTWRLNVHEVTALAAACIFSMVNHISNKVGRESTVLFFPSSDMVPQFFFKKLARSYYAPSIFLCSTYSSAFDEGEERKYTAQKEGGKGKGRG